MALAMMQVPGVADAKASDPRAKRREVQQARAKKAVELNVLKASDAEVGRALDALNANLRAREARARDSDQAAVAASQAAEAARQAEQQTATELADLRESMRKVAVNAYVRGPTEQALAVLDVGSMSELTTRRHLLDVVLGRGTDLSDQLRQTQEDLADQRAAADQAKDQAADRRAEADEELQGVKGAVASQQKVADSVEERLERALAESASLASLDKNLADEIAKRQADLARRIGPVIPRVGRGGGGGGSVNVTSVRGIVVANQIAGQVEGLLAAASADGIVLSGSGYRDSGDQIAVRKANCGGDVYNKPASSCRPPTARPGQSMHERGLAIDFTHNGSIINSRSSPAFVWLKGNASRFGLYNLPAEPWHWSVNGN